MTQIQTDGSGRPLAEWDGKVLPYRPVDFAPGDGEQREQIDPITFEIVKHGLWNVNDEHGMTITKVSGSPFSNDAYDYNTVLLTAAGEYVFFGPSIQHFAGTMDFPIRWILEHLEPDLGIADGDMFLSNDPWIGAIHQSDVQVACPVFWHGELFCWVANALHQYDMGGKTPGSFCADARDVFDEPTPISPIKIVEQGRLRPDLERMYLRHSRRPEMLALDLRAQIAGNLVARDRIRAFLQRYGAEVVGATMQKVIDDTEQSFVTRLRRVPDGTWRHETHVEAALPGDRAIYRVALSVEKRGDMLRFTNEGSHDQAGALNASYAGWRAAILSIVNPLLCHDQMYAIGGALRHLRFDATPGTINCPTFPASVTNAQIGTLIAGTLATIVMGKLAASDDELRNQVFSTGATLYPMSAISGLDQFGRSFGSGFLDPMGGAIGASASSDGVDTGGVVWSPRSLMPNVEQVEAAFPVLYLYRRELSDSGGAGRFRGGNAATFAFVPHGTDAIVHAPAASGCAFPPTAGLAGGYPANPNAFRLKRGTDVAERFAQSRIPQELDLLAGESVLVDPKRSGLIQRADDVWEVTWGAATGYGDPLEREPARVLDDLIHGRVTPQSTIALYGVVLVRDGAGRPAIDDAATAAERAARRAARLRHPLLTTSSEGVDDASH
ncbi:hydantoinase B/oxoprolinase family protein [Conexibacter sp. CPCC 206217]|uniref:hydantoinase B/oxoprolinase family protein n=1 Tax=Conexibacter sp. CPCC 206217 TaxID=3064574 RepID=UPI00271F7FBC|nr:hydantoinase B/oxoprolinase family protein [Conexibacter sp. CPCC 206217]MDO8208809.1 hydantoinase B/oxoprolinase family protein [Conexibacter sp. CPCC 206217]